MSPKVRRIRKPNVPIHVTRSYWGGYCACGKHDCPKTVKQKGRSL